MENHLVPGQHDERQQYHGWPEGTRPLGSSAQPQSPYAYSQPNNQGGQQHPIRHHGSYGDPTLWSVHQSPGQTTNPPGAPQFNSPGNLDWADSSQFEGQLDQGTGSFPSEEMSRATSETMHGMFDGGLYDPGAEDFSNEPPLLEELEINFDHIWGKTKVVLFPFKRLDADRQSDAELLHDTDLIGPIFFLVCLGCSLLLQGKIQFGYIYGFGIFCCVALYVLLNLLSPPNSPDINFWRVVSTLGYCLLPVVMVAVLGIFFQLTGLVGSVICGVAILWCTFTATRDFQEALGMQKQRFLIAYPIGVLYSCFVLISIF